MSCLPPKISLSDPFELQTQNLYFDQLSNLLIHSIVSLSMFFFSSNYTKRASPLIRMNAILPFGLLIRVSYPYPVLEKPIYPPLCIFNVKAINKIIFHIRTEI